MDWKSVKDRKRYFRRYYVKHIKKLCVQHKDRRAKYRQTVFDHYGWCCACCGESESGFLTIDHINNDGYKLRHAHAPARNRGGVNFYAHLASLIKQGKAPTDIQTLCWNCNCGKQWNKGVCPHKEHV